PQAGHVLVPMSVTMSGRLGAILPFEEMGDRDGSAHMASSKIAGTKRSHRGRAPTAWHARLGNRDPHDAAPPFARPAPRRTTTTWRRSCGREPRGSGGEL